MSSAWSYAGSVWLAIIALAGWLAASGAAGLRHGGSAGRLRRKARKPLTWSFWLLFAVFGMTVTAIGAWRSSGWSEARDAIALQLLPVLLPVMFILAFSLPRIAALRNGPLKAAKQADREVREPSPQSPAVHSLIVFPYQAAVLGALASLFNSILARSGIRPDWTPVLAAACLAAALYAVQLRKPYRFRLSEVRLAELAPPLRRALGILTVAGATIGMCVLYGARSSLLPPHSAVSNGSAKNSEISSSHSPIIRDFSRFYWR